MPIYREVVHLVDRLALPDGYTARPYRGRDDHADIASVLAEYRAHHGVAELPTVEQLDVAYAHLVNCDPERDIAILESSDRVVGYARVTWEDLETGVRDCELFDPIRVDHLEPTLFSAVVEGQQRHMADWAAAAPPARWRAFASHPGPRERATGEAAWLEGLGFEATEWGASLVRPHLDDIADRPLPVGVEVRPVTPEQIRPILEAGLEAFRGEWDFREPTEDDYREIIDNPYRDESLWKVAWAGDTVVGQVKTFINPEENADRGYRRGYTEYISTHRDWRNRGIAGALLAMSLHELRDRGMTEAALGVDTNNPGGAFQLYTGLGFELRSYEAVYTKPVG